MSVTISGDGTITGLDADGISSQPVFPGNVLQVVQGTTSTAAASTSSTTYADTNLAATITPTSASSKILVVAHQGGCFCGTVANGLDIRLLRGATAITNIAIAYNYGAADDIMGIPVVYLDSPETTSSTTYKTQFKRFTGAGTANVQANSNPSYMILMEIAG